MTDTYESYEILFAAYANEEGAAGAVESLKAMDKAKTINIIDAATLVKQADGTTSVNQESLPSVKRGLGVGALIGGAIGLVFPPSILGAAAIGAGIGAGGAKIAKTALENDELNEAAESLEPGSSAFIAVVENTWVAQLQEVISGYEKLATHTLDAEAAGVIGALSSDSEAVVYGSVDAGDAAAEFVVAMDEGAVAGHSTVAAIGEDGDVMIDHVEGVVAADGEGDIASVVTETAVYADEDGNVAVAQSTQADVIVGLEGAEDDEAAADDSETDV